MGIPALIGTDIPLNEAVDGKMAVVDGAKGCIYVEPDEETMAQMQEMKRQEEEQKELLAEPEGQRECHKRWTKSDALCEHRQY